MSDEENRRGRRAARQRSIYQVHYGLSRDHEQLMAKPLPKTCEGLQAYGRQVAGHMKTEDEKYLGVLQCNNGTILKPIIRDSQNREIDFYTQVSSATLPDLAELRKYAPKYFGCRKFTYNGHEQDYVVLQDLAERMLEPCIMDVKIGKRTWDPLASEQKIRSEESKYALCKQEFGFCIPGFQVHRLGSGNLCRYNKEYGKKLHGKMVTAAMRNFLNGIGTNLCRALILQFLSELWKIQKWAARQTCVRLYATSLLLVYDAVRLRDCCGDTSGDELMTRAKCRAAPPPAPPDRRRSIHSMHSDAGSAFSGQLSAKGPVYKKVNSVPLSPMSLSQSSFSPPNANHSRTQALEALHHNHSFDHNYEDKLSKIKMNYKATLDQLCTDTPTPNPWGTVKIIDFAHAFFNEEDGMGVDENFKTGIDSVVEIFEGFLSETVDQVL